MTLGLTLGSFALVGGEGNGWAAHLRGADQDWGNPTPQDVAIQSLLQGGAPTVTQGWDNREQRFIVDIEASDSSSLAAGEAAFMVEIGRPNLLVHTPHDGWGKPTAFEVWTSHLEYLPDDLVETFEGCYTYALVLTIRPWARALDEAMTEAIDVPGEDDPGWTPIDVVVDNGSSTSGWSPGAGSASGTTVASSSGAVRSVAPSSSVDAPSLRRVGSVPTTATQLLVVDWRYAIAAGQGGGYTQKVQAWLQYGTSSQDRLEVVAVEPAPAGGYTRTTFALPPAASFNDITFFGAATKPLNGGERQATGALWIDQIRRTNTPPAIGTARQKLRQLEVKGSVTTEGSLEITHDTDDLGHVLAYTWVDPGVDFLPTLRSSYLSGGVVNDDGTTVSGGYNDLDDMVTFEVPVSRLPRGLFQLWGRVRSDFTGTVLVNWSAQTYIGGTAVGPAQNGTARLGFGTTNTWRFVTLAKTLSLPPVDVAEGSTATVRITVVAADPGTAEIDLDEGYLLWLRRDNEKTGAVTYVGMPATTTRLRIDTPTTDTPRPRILTGNAEDWTDAFYPADSVAAWEVHEFKPPVMNVLTVAEAEDVKVRLRHYPRAHSHSVE